VLGGLADSIERRLNLALSLTQMDQRIQRLGSTTEARIGVMSYGPGEHQKVVCCCVQERGVSSGLMVLRSAIRSQLIRCRPPEQVMRDAEVASVSDTERNLPNPFAASVCPTEGS
jgi:hypothetical protein